MAGTLGVVLSGGSSRRFGGGDKALALLSGTPLIGWVLERLKPQVDSVAISTHGDAASYGAFGYPLLGDGGDGREGPMAGVLAALRHASLLGLPDAVTVPCDAPLIPADLVARLRAARGDAPCAFAMTDGKLNPVFALYRADLKDAVSNAFDSGVRAPRDLADRLGARFAMFTDENARALADIDTAADLADFPLSGLAQ